MYPTPHSTPPPDTQTSKCCWIPALSPSFSVVCVQCLFLSQFQVFQNLLELLWSVAQHEEENKMSSHSLALMFAPNLIWTSSQSTLSGAELDRFSSVLHYMIQNCYEVFEVQFIYFLYTKSGIYYVYIRMYIWTVL